MTNWTKLAAIGRAMFMVAGVSFFGALVIPVANDGTIPTTWVAWKTILFMAASAAVLAEVLWIRSHLQQASTTLSQVSDIISNNLTAPSEATVTAVKVAGTALLCCFLFGCTSTGSLTPTAGTVVSEGAPVLDCALQAIAKDTTVSPINYVQVALDLAGCGMNLLDMTNEFGQNSAIVVAANQNASEINDRAAKAKSRLGITK